MDTTLCGRGKRIRKAPDRLDPGDDTAVRSRSRAKTKKPKIKKKTSPKKKPAGWWRKSESDTDELALIKAMFANERAASAVVRRHFTAARRDNEELRHKLRAANGKFEALKSQLDELVVINAQMRATAESKQQFYASALPAEVEVRSAEYVYQGVPLHTKLAVLGVYCAHPANAGQRIVVDRTDAVPIF